MAIRRSGLLRSQEGLERTVVTRLTPDLAPMVVGAPDHPPDLSILRLGGRSTAAG